MLPMWPHIVQKYEPFFLPFQRLTVKSTPESRVKRNGNLHKGMDQSDARALPLSSLLAGSRKAADGSKGAGIDVHPGA